MRQNVAVLSSRVTVCLLAVSLAACSSSATDVVEDAPIPDFQGAYSITGTYSPRTGDNTGIFGTMTITDQADSTAMVSVALKILDHGNTSFTLNLADPGVRASSEPKQARLKSDGSFFLEITGREEISGIDPKACCNFTLKFNGTLSGSSISGGWELTRDMPSRDTGTFSASR